MSRSYRDIGPDNGHGVHVFDLIPAYIDETLERDEHEFVRAHLDACPECHADYIELRATQQMLRSVPVVVPPRAFTLTEEMVAQPKRRSLLDVFLAPRNTPRFAFGSVLSFALLLLILSSNVLLGSTVNNTFSRIGSGLGGYSASSEAAAPAPNKIQAYASEVSPTPAAMAAGAPSMDMPAGTLVPETSSGAIPGELPLQAQVTQVPSRRRLLGPSTPAIAGSEVGIGGGTDTSAGAAQAEATPGALGDVSAWSQPSGTPVAGGYSPQWSGDGSLTEQERDARLTESYTPPAAPFPTIEVALALLGALMAAAAFLARRR